MSALLAALRVARRDALRARGRSALIMVMIGLPVLVFTAMLTIVANVTVDSREGLTADLGAAEARVIPSSLCGPVTQDLDGSSLGHDPEASCPPPSWTAAKVAAHLPPGTRLLPVTSGGVGVVIDGEFTRFEATEVDLRDPLSAPSRPLREGRLPETAGEVVVTPAVGVRAGGTVNVTWQQSPMRVVGVVEYPYKHAVSEITGLPGTLLRPGTDRTTSWLADTPGPVLWSDARRLNQVSLTVRSRAVIENPPDIDEPDRSPVNTPVAVGVAVVMVVLETVLLAGPAFVVGLRRRRRELAVLAAQGASPRHLRGIVLADGLVLGGAASLVSAVLGVGLGLAGAPLGGQVAGSLGPVEVPWAQVAGVAVLGLLSAVIAALVPAVQAARQETATVLAGRAPHRNARAGRPVIGLLLVLAGLAALVAALQAVEWVLAAAILVLLGLVALMPLLVRLTGRLAVRLPLPGRLAVRDAARHGTRTASAAAAVMAATAMTIAAGIGLNSDYMDNLDDYHPSMPEGTLVISGRNVDESAWNELKAAAVARLPGVDLVAAGQLRTATGARIGLSVRTDKAVFMGETLPIGDQRLLRLLQGRDDQVAAAALAEGKAVVFEPELVRDGHIVVSTWTIGERTDEPAELRLPAVVAAPVDPRQIGVVLPPIAVEKDGRKVVERQLYAALPSVDANSLARELMAVNERAEVRAEKGFRQEIAVMLWILLGGALVLVVGGTLVATALATADMRPDLDTLSAVGARSRTRRLVVAGQAAYVAGLGAVVGLVAGAVIGVALAWPLTAGTRDGSGAMVAVPWPFVLVVVLGLPVLAALVAGAFARTRPHLARRLT
ncbi:FtsX-like permease family protein [Nonomuraea sp. NPDC046570]|uniref:FtsX-like permease family protein n=1 Tax=Nonomuraea sp. NPDC046570 TaxID=3155255 RepID=UPI0033D143D2